MGVRGGGVAWGVHGVCDGACACACACVGVLRACCGRAWLVLDYKGVVAVERGPLAREEQGGDAPEHLLSQSVSHHHTPTNGAHDMHMSHAQRS